MFVWMFGEPIGLKGIASHADPPGGAGWNFWTRAATRGRRGDRSLNAKECMLDMQGLIFGGRDSHPRVAFSIIELSMADCCICRKRFGCSSA